MHAFLKKFQSFTQSILQSSSHPSSSSHSNSHNRNLPLLEHYKHNQALFLIPYLAFIFFILDLLHRRGPTLISLFGCLVCILIGTSKLTSRFCSDQAWSLLYNALLGIYAVHFSYLCNGGNIFSAWLGVLIFPIIVYFITKSLKHFIIQSALQLVWLNTVYQSQIERVMIMKTPEELKANLTSSLQFVLVIIGIFIAIWHHYSSKNHIKAKIEFKPDIQQQKNFLLGFSHELRNLINGIMGNIKLASYELLPEKAKDLLLNAELCGELLLHLITNILDVGKIEINELEFNNDSTRIYDTMESTWKVCSELIQKKNLKGRMRIQKNIPKVLKIDHYRLRQVLLNLFENSVKFTASGLIDVCVEFIRDTENVTEKCFEPYPFNEDNDQDEGIFEKKQAFTVFNEDFEVLNSPYIKMKKETPFSNEERNRGVLKISVTDSGCGISRDEIPKLFNQFNKANANNRRQLSNGLGLFITKKICEKMNGKIQVYSKKGKGSSFVVCVPVEPIPNTIRSFYKIDTMDDILVQKNLKAMVVDDDPLNSEIIGNFFNVLGVEVTEKAYNGIIAHEKYMNSLRRGKELHIVTMDLDMPIMNGKESSEKIREFERSEGFEPCILIIISANSFQSEVEECMHNEGKIRANAFLKKPVSADDLRRVIIANFEESYLRKSNRQSF